MGLFMRLGFGVDGVVDRGRGCGWMSASGRPRIFIFLLRSPYRFNMPP
jgi:hypothetical protein